MANMVTQPLAKPIQLADQVTKAADEASSFKQECAELKSKTEKLAALLRQAARASSDLYERPTRRIIDDNEQVFEKALSLVFKSSFIFLIHSMFDKMPQRDVVSWNVMITHMVKTKNFDGAYGLFTCMPERNVRSWTMMISSRVHNDKPN